LYFFALSFSLKKPVLGCNKEALLPRNMVPKVSGWVRCFTGCHELLQSNLSRGEEIRAGRGDLRTQDLWGSACRKSLQEPWPMAVETSSEKSDCVQVQSGSSPADRKIRVTLGNLPSSYNVGDKARPVLNYRQDDQKHGS
jgi:hypothetical protein